MKFSVVSVLLFLAVKISTASNSNTDSARVEDYTTFLKSDSIFDKKYLFVGELHGSWANNDYILKDILEKAKRKKDTLYLILEVSPSVERLMNSYFITGADSLHFRLAMEGKHHWNGWLLSKTDVLFRYFRNDILSNTLIIKGIEPEISLGQSLEYLYEICNSLKLSDKNRNLLNQVYDKWESRAKIRLKEYLPLVIIFEKELLDSNSNYSMSKYNRDFLIRDFNAVHQLDDIQAKAGLDKAKGKKLKAEALKIFLFEREKILFSNFKQIQSISSSNKMLSMLGAFHVSKIPNPAKVEPNISLTMMLKNEKLIQDYYVISLVDQRIVSRLSRHKITGEIFNFFLNHKVEPYTVYHFTFPQRHYDSVVFFQKRVQKFQRLLKD